MDFLCFRGLNDAYFLGMPNSVRMIKVLCGKYRKMSRKREVKKAEKEEVCGICILFLYSVNGVAKIEHQ